VSRGDASTENLSNCDAWVAIMRRAVLATLSTITGIVVLLGFKSAPTRAARPPFVSPVSSSVPPVGEAPATSPNSAAIAAPNSAPVSSAAVAPATQAAAPTPTSSAGPTKPSASTPTPRGSATPAPKPASGTFLGSSVQTRYGPVQIKITYAAGRVTGVVAVQLPSGRSRDAEINNYAVPILESETLAAQSANINSVSGATYTSDGYVQSLQSALDAAHR
jgi:uncharacterized protein with FMN-binding domain